MSDELALLKNLFIVLEIEMLYMSNGSFTHINPNTEPHIRRFYFLKKTEFQPSFSGLSFSHRTKIIAFILRFCAAE